MTKQTITLLGLEDTTSKNGKNYLKVKTTDGNMSAFDKPVIDALRASWNNGKICVVDVATNDRGFTNIRGFVEIAPQGEIPTEKIKTETKSNGYKKDTTSMYVSYAKDIFIASIASSDARLTPEQCKEVMKTCIDLVKQAYEEFK